MSMILRFSGSVLAVAALCLSAQVSRAQSMANMATAVPYAQENWPIGFGGNLGMGANAYGDAANFDGTTARPSGWFMSSQSSDLSLGLSGLNRMSAFGGGSLQSDGMRFGYNFQNSPVSVYGGFNSLKYDPGLASTFAPSALSGLSGTSGYNMQAGVEFRPTSNLSLQLGASFTQMQPGGMAGSNAPPLTGESSGFDRVRAR